MTKRQEIAINVPHFKRAGFTTNRDRSVNMSKIRGKETASEKKLRKSLWHLGVRYRKNFRKLQGKPDIAITKFKLAIFIDGEFWHGYNWEEYKQKIKTNREYWIPKIERNMQRDRANNEILNQQGWTVLRFWEREIKTEFDACIIKILNYII